jgi:predicted ArsR family transcriptional regulator
VKKTTTQTLPSEDLKTRDRLARAILEAGPSTAVALAERLQITPAGVRRHLDALVNDGLLVAREPYQHSSNTRGRGRPSKVFVMTDIGREEFEHSYDDLAVLAIKYMNSESGAAMVAGFANARAEDLERRAKPFMAKAKTDAAKFTALAEFLSGEGFVANVHDQGIGQELCQHHCPIAHVAAQFPELCEAETAAFSRLTGTHVQRLATIAHGDGVCTTFIPKLIKKTTTEKVGKRA